MRNHVIVSIGLVVILTLTICPLLADESDGTIATYRFMDGTELISWCLSDDIVVPEPEKEGMEFIGWTVRGEWVDPYTYSPEPGDISVTFYAHFREIPEPAPDNNTFVALCILGAVILMICILMYWFARLRHC